MAVREVVTVAQCVGAFFNENVLGVEPLGLRVTEQSRDYYYKCL